MPCCSRGGCSLYYEFYIDQFFLEQVIMQGLLLLLASKTAGKHLTCRRLGAGSLIGAGMMTLFLCAGSRALAFSGSLMAGSAALAGKKWREIPRDLAILLFVTLCFGGVVQAAVELTGIPAAAGSCAAFFLLHFAGKKQRERRLCRRREAEVKITWESESMTVKGIVDTGNSLQEPLGKSPVSILDQEAAGRLLPDGWETRRGFYLIPYRSIGRKKGWMRAFRADEMQVVTAEGTVIIRGPILAISGNELSGDGRYRIILHPQHAGETYV